MSTAPHPGRKRAKKHEEEEHENHERWLVSYADMVTLLLVTFVVLYAMSQVDKDKFAALASGLSEVWDAYWVPKYDDFGRITKKRTHLVYTVDAVLQQQFSPSRPLDVRLELTRTT